jgi:hypothetical protein
MAAQERIEYQWIENRVVEKVYFRDLKDEFSRKKTSAKAFVD